MRMCVWVRVRACSPIEWKGAVASGSEDHSGGQLFSVAFPVYVIMHENTSDCSNKEKVRVGSIKRLAITAYC